MNSLLIFNSLSIFNTTLNFKLPTFKILRDEEGRKLGLKNSDKNSGSTDNDVKMAEVEASSNRNGDPSKSELVEDAPGKEKALTGIYDLVAVLTHKGRRADSGHYIAWVKQETGDWHMAYICMYKARDVSMRSPL
ncbi:unnamed protein product [Fraxinus pennsylvanica]|uniref:ubiquitinyl hydrolase 1 n=1 Tax=Fraxinus pennsylvanica TaxID=56036 RepID=A0AAD2DWB6_9LAMI|nr:unnamed protein product [Fraxinus pennsylvanica]